MVDQDEVVASVIRDGKRVQLRREVTLISQAESHSGRKRSIIGCNGAGHQADEQPAPKFKVWLWQEEDALAISLKTLDSCSPFVSGKSHHDRRQK